MKSRALPMGLGLCLALATAAPVAAQMWYFPDYALPAGGTPATWMAGTYGRGLNDNSGKVDAIGAAIGRTTERASFMASFGYITDGAREYTTGGAVGINLTGAEGPQLSLQGGVGFMNLDFLGETVNLLRFPIGIALRGNLESGTSSVTPWVMPRVNISYLSGNGESETETDFGASAGLSFTTESGLGLHTAIDALFSEGNAFWQMGVGLHFRVGQ